MSNNCDNYRMKLFIIIDIRGKKTDSMIKLPNTTLNGYIWRPAGRELPINDDPTYLRVRLNVNDGQGDVAYMGASFFSRSHISMPVYELYVLNERLAASVSFFTNSVVVLVFLRVLCLKRLTSQLLVSLALCNLVFTLSHSAHELLTTSYMLKNMDNFCKFTHSLAITSWVLIWTNLSFALTERVLAINMPSYHLATHTLIASISNISPWAYFICLVMLGFLGFFGDDGYGCANHLIFMSVGPSRMVIQLLTFAILIALLVVLILSRFLHPEHADDALESNILRMEMKTTSIITKITIVHVLFCLPLMLSTTLTHYNGIRSTLELKVNLAFYQLAVHGNSVVFFVMLRRPEFRKAMALIFSSSASIRKVRPMNLLLELSEARRKKSSDVDEVDSSFGGVAKVTAREDYKKMSISPALK